MKFLGSVLASVLLVVGQSSGKSCKTCRGANCLSDDVFELDCTKFVPPLPFESMLFSTGVSEDSEYGCLDLSYYSGGSSEHLQQCILANDISSYCNMLEEILKVTSCNVGATGEKRNQLIKENKLRHRDEIVEEGEEEGNTEPAPTESPPESTTAGASVAVLFPFMSLVTVIVTLSQILN